MNYLIFNYCFQKTELKNSIPAFPRAHSSLCMAPLVLVSQGFSKKEASFYLLLPRFLQHLFTSAEGLYEFIQYQNAFCPIYSLHKYK